MRSPRPFVVAVLMLAACSKLGESGAPVAIEFLVAAPGAVEIGDTIQLRARVLDQNGDSVGATIRWRTPDSTVAVDSMTGRFWGVVLGDGNGRVQPVSGSLVGALNLFTVRARADTLIIPLGADSLVVTAADTASAPLGPKVAKSDGTGLANRRLIITLLTPTDSSVRLSGDVAVDTILTGTGGVPAASFRLRRTGVAWPDSAVVKVEARRTSGAVVPGSGQKIRVFLQ
ncbi:MAG: hypothetical protein ABIQ41_02975 [Gemmatimonadales bacterium]